MLPVSPAPIGPHRNRGGLRALLVVALALLLASPSAWATPEPLPPPLSDTTPRPSPTPPAPPDEPLRLDAGLVGRVLVRARGDLAGAARVLDTWGRLAPESPLTPSAAVPIWARMGDPAAVGRVLLGAVIEPEIRGWLVATAARGLAQRDPVLAAGLARSAIDLTPGGREALKVTAQLLEEAGALEDAAAVIASGLGVPWDRLSWVPAKLVMALPPMDDAAAEAERGWLLLDAWASNAAVEAFERALSLPHTDERVRCAALHGLARATLKSTKATDVRARLREARDACPGDASSRQAAVYLARLAFAADEVRELDEAVAWMERRDPEQARREGLTALQGLAQAEGALAPLKKAVQRRFGRLVGFDPVGDEAMALWRSQFEKGRYAAAAEILGTLVDHGYGASRQRDWGRVEYWLGRTWQAAGDRDRAVDAFARAAEQHPISWYGLRSLEALEALAPERAAELRTLVEEARALGGPSAAEPDWAVDGAAREAAGRVAALQRWGLFEAMEAEIRRAGFEGHTGRALWAARMLHAAGGHRAGTRVALNALERAGSWSPHDGYQDLWREAWPTPFRGWVTREAEAAGVDPYLVWAVMRIESYYEPTAVSHAGARGLLQLMPATAAWLRDLLPEASDEGDLFDPPHNVLLGVRMLERMAMQYAGSKPLMLAAYNAGPGRVSRMLKKDKREDLDLFVEDFPFEEARNYVRSVLGAWAAYHWLDGCECLVRLDERR